VEYVDFVKKYIPHISAINFPDLLRFDIRAWSACSMMKDTNLEKIAHLRAIDFDLDKPFALKDFFKENNISKVLVIKGDKPDDMPDAVFYPTETVDFIRKLKSEVEGLSIYAGFDPYRTNIRYEIQYLQDKAQAGAIGFFSQPFFDLRLLEIYSEYLEGYDVYWGVSPVTTESAKLYWETRNRAIFPKTFTPSLDWNVNFAKKVLTFCEKSNFNMYLMPINIDLKKYLRELFDVE
jgi:methylenetetrahydrofolate reductase (NADPH)